MAVTATQLNELYLAYFGRPVDFNGFSFYTNNPASTEATVAAAFSASAESQALYGVAGANTAAVVDAIYRNLFNRGAEVAGLNYWVGQINKGIISAPEAALVILRAAVGTDATSVANKLGISQAFFNALDTTPELIGYSGTQAAADARAYIATVNETAASVTAATAALPATVAAVTGVGGPAGQNLSFTSGVDEFVGTGASDTYTGTLQAVPNGTVTPLDSVDGAGGNDFLNVNAIDGTAFPASVVVKNVETLNFAAALGATVDTTANFTGLNALNVTQGTAATVTAGSTTAVSISGISGNITSDGGSSQTVSTAGANAAVAIGIGAGANPAGVVSVTHTKQGTGAIAIDGGTSVSVAASGVSTGTVAIGQGGAAADMPSGAVAVNSTGAASVANTDVALGAIAITGGTNVNVNQTATSSSSAAAADTVGATITQSAVTVTGGTATTSVTVTQSAPVAEVAAVTAVAGALETNVVTFAAAAAAGVATTVGGLTFTSSKALTAAQVAAAFANLTEGATQGSAPAGNGVYSGVLLAGWTSGAVVASGANQTVTVSSTTQTNAVDLVVAGAAVVKTDGSAATAATTGVLGVVGGKATINGAIAGADVLASVTLGGYGAGSTVVSDALTTLTLANSASDVVVTNTLATTLGLSVSGVTKGSVANLGATYTTLNLAVTGADSDVDVIAGGVTALNISGDKALILDGATALGALKTVTITGSAGVTANASGATVTSVDASGTSGNNTITVDASKATYTGGSGKDAVTLSAVAIGKAVSLGAGDDSLTLATGTVAVPTANLSGGDGTDTLAMAAADAAAFSTATVFETKIDGFEKLSLAVAATDVVDLSNMDDISYVISAGNAVSLTLNKMAAGGTVELTAAGVLVDVNLTDATGTADSLNVVTKVSAANVNFGVVDAAGVESIAITATDTATKTIETATLNLKDAALKTVTATGNSNLTLTLDANVVALTSLDASAMTGKLSAMTNGTVAQTILGGSGADTLVGAATGSGDTLTGGAGGDTLVVLGDLTKLTGGAGADTFNVADATTNVNSYASITDLAAGDKIQFSAAANTFAASKVVLAGTAVFQDYANAAINLTNTGDVSWFQFGGNTYVVENSSNGASFLNGTDFIVQIVGTVDLSTASFSSTADTLLIV